VVGKRWPFGTYSRLPSRFFHRFYCLPECYFLIISVQPSNTVSVMTHHGQLPEDGLGERHLSTERLAYPLCNSVWSQIDAMAESERVAPGTIASAVFAILLNRLAGEPVTFLSQRAFHDDAHRQLVCLKPQSGADDFAAVVGCVAQADTHDDARRSHHGSSDAPEDAGYGS